MQRFKWSKARAIFLPVFGVHLRKEDSTCFAPLEPLHFDILPQSDIIFQRFSTVTLKPFLVASAALPGLSPHSFAELTAQEIVLVDRAVVGEHRRLWVGVDQGMERNLSRHYWLELSLHRGRRAPFQEIFRRHRGKAPGKFDGRMRDHRRRAGEEVEAP